MLRWFDLLMRLYPADWRAEFADEMREVFRNAAPRNAWCETVGLVAGAARQRLPSLMPLAGGAALALTAQMAIYVALLPHAGRILQRTIQNLAAFLMLICIVTGAGLAQQPAQDAATVALAQSIYDHAFAAIRNAKTIADLHKAADELDSPDWVSIDHFGRTVRTGHDTDRELESMAALPPEQRVARMDIIWAEQDGDRLAVLIWIAPREIVTAGQRLIRGTLVQDLFEKRSNIWKRIRHEKLTPDGMILAVDGASRFMPPLP